MKINRSSQSKVSALQKTALVFLGLLLSFVLLEGGLRLGGFVLLSIQDLGNQRSIQQKGAYRILCLGESTTQGQYPSFLEKALNERNIGVRFSVIDKGLAGTLTPVILSRVDSFLDEYQPDMVVAMMGINDWGKHMPLEAVSKEGGFIQSFRTYKLARLLWLHLTAKVAEVKDCVGAIGRRVEKIQTLFSQIGSIPPAGRSGGVTEPDHKNAATLVEAGWLYRSKGRFVEAGEAFRKAIGIDPGNSSAYTGLGRVYLDQGQVREAEKALKRALALDPRSFQVYVEMGRLYRSQGKVFEAERSFTKAIALNPQDENAHIECGRLYQHEGELSEAERCYRKAVEADPKSDRGYEELGWFYQAQGRFAEAEVSFKKILERDPGNKEAYANLGRIYRVEGKYSEAEHALKKIVALDPGNKNAYVEFGRIYRAQHKFAEARDALAKVVELDPQDDNGYVELGWLYQYQGEFLEAEAYFRKALEIAPRNGNAYAELGWIYQEQGRVSEAKALLKRGIGLCSGNDRLLGALALLYQQIGEPELGDEYAQQADRLREFNNPMTANNYRKLKAILDKRRIRLVCVQYPTRNVGPLKKLFGKESGVIFVDNERVFKEALKKDGYKAYFTDMFAGDFGHCTPRGNELLAENIAATILREAFDK